MIYLIRLPWVGIDWIEEYRNSYIQSTAATVTGLAGGVWSSCGNFGGAIIFGNGDLSNNLTLNQKQPVRCVYGILYFLLR